MAAKGLFGLSDDIPSYEDEDLADVDPSLTGFKDDEEDIDLLNDDTFGSGAVDDDWEEAHRQLAGLDIKAMPPQLQPKFRDKDEEDLDAEEEILEQNLARLVDDEEESDPKKLYATTGYKDIPSAPISSVWNGSPLSSPTSSDSFNDLIHPSIWASPDHLSRSSNNTKVQSSQGPTRPPPGFEARDTKPYRRPFSPAFEDEAILTALPKKETLLPPSSFTKKIPTNAIRLEDLEKDLSDNKPGQAQSTVMENRQQPMHPPPGLPSHLRMMTPQRHPLMRPQHQQQQLHTPHGMPPPPPHNTPQHIYHGQNSPRPGMPFPRTPHMVSNRLVYNKMPISAGTPPHLQYRQRMTSMHSDPAHLMRMYHSMPPPRPRFSSPQGYQPHMRYHDNRNYDNRYRDHNQQRENNQPAYQPSDLERKIHSILNDERVNDMDPYAGLMTRREKEWIIKIQLLQLTSSNPYMDDFYFQTYIRRKRAKERAKQGEGVEDQPVRGRQTAKMTLPDFEREDRQYKPTAFVGTLGKLSASHIAHPREMVQVPHIHKETDQDKQGASSLAKDTKRRQQMLAVIEKGFDLVLQLDDIDNNQLQATPEERTSLLEKKQSVLSKLSSLLKLTKEHDITSRAEFLCQLLSFRKGKVLVSRLLHVLDKSEGDDMLLSICQHVVTVIKKDHQDEVLPLLIGPLSRIIETTSMETALQCFTSIVHGNSEPLSIVLANQFGINVLCLLLKRATSLRIEADHNKDIKNSWDGLISHVTKQFNEVPVKLLAKNLTGVTPLVTVLGSCANPSDMSNLQQHYRLALSTREEMSS